MPSIVLFEGIVTTICLDQTSLLVMKGLRIEFSLSGVSVQKRKARLRGRGYVLMMFCMLIGNIGVKGGQI